MKQTAIALHVRMKQWCQWSQGFEGVENRRQLFVVHLDQAQSLFSDVFGFCRHRGDFLADETNHAIRQKRHVVNLAPYEQTRDLSSANHGSHAG